MDLFGSSSRKLTPSEMLDEELGRLMSGAQNQPKPKATQALMPPAEAKKRQLMQQIGEKAKAKKAAAPTVVVNNITAPAAPKDPAEMRLDLINDRRADPRLTMKGVEDQEINSTESENSLATSMGSTQSQEQETEELDYAQQLRQSLPTDDDVKAAILQNTDTSDLEAGIADQALEIEKIRSAPTQLNLRGLAQFADVINQGKTNWAKIYQAPMSGEERAVLISKLQDAINEKRKGVLDIHGQRLKQLLDDKVLTKQSKGVKIGTGTKQESGTQIKEGTSTGTKTGTTITDETPPPVRPTSGRSQAVSDDKLFADVQKLGKERAKHGPTLFNSLEGINRVLQKEAKTTLADIAATDGKNVKSLPGVGGLNSLMPEFARKESQAELYQYAMDLALAKLNMRSGQAASESEARRYLTQFGLTIGSSPRAFAQGLVKLVKDTRGQLAAEEASFVRPGVREAYAAQPGRVLSTDLDKYLTSQKKSVPRGGKKDYNSLSNEQLEKLMREKGLMQ